MGTLLVIVGVFAAAWVATVWLWKDPFTALYTEWEQHRLSGIYEKRFRSWHSDPHRRRLPQQTALALLNREARRYRLVSKRGDPIGRIIVPRLGLNMILVNGTDESTLEKGPGRDLRTYMPGEGQLVYIAGHRTTFLAPFSNIDDLRAGDPATISLPYATFRYRITHHIIVPADNLTVLRSRGVEELALQACHPRFFATHRYVAYARPVWVRLRGRAPRYRLWS